jgi:hypothetical protein
MTTRQLSLVAFLLIVPIMAEAQRGGGGGGSSRPKRGFGAADGKQADSIIRNLADSPSLSKDLQKANPVETLLGKKKDLQLTADEEKQLKAINESLKDAVKPFFKSIDSVSKENKKTGEYAPTQGQMLIGRQLTRAYVDSVVSRYGSAEQEAVAKLAAEHQQAANDLLDKEEKDREAKAQASRPARPPL